MIIDIKISDVGEVVINNDNDELLITEYHYDKVDGDTFYLTYINTEDGYWVNVKGVAYELCENYSVKEFKND